MELREKAARKMGGSESELGRRDELNSIKHILCLYKILKTKFLRYIKQSNMFQAIKQQTNKISVLSKVRYMPTELISEILAIQNVFKEM